VNLLDAIARHLPAPRLTKARIAAAFGVALACDALQVFFGPLGWWAPDEVLDVIAFGLITWLIGFHVLLLPTFAVEFIPVIDMLPTWTGCVAAVVALRSRAQRNAPPASMTAAPPVIHSPPQLADASPQSPPPSPQRSSDPADANPS
jgi:hypothetical protein